MVWGYVEPQTRGERASPEWSVARLVPVSIKEFSSSRVKHVARVHGRGSTPRVSSHTPEPVRNSYEFHPAEVAEPPRDFFGILRRIGPGMILSASIVGSGELIATTTLGAEVGYVALWIITLSCIIKPAVQSELGRFASGPLRGRPAGSSDLDRSAAKVHAVRRSENEVRTGRCPRSRAKRSRPSS